MMNKKQFLKEMASHLLGIPEDEAKDILYDFQEYFNAGLQDGRTEEELAASLGDPKILAKQVKTEYMVRLARTTPNLRNLYNASLATMGLGFFKMIGFTLILIGIGLFFNQLTPINLSLVKTWPLFVLGLGTAFQVSYFTNPLRGKANITLLIPGGILTIGGLLFLGLTFTQFIYIATLWPILILAVAVGLFQFYYFGNRSVWILLPVMVLVITGALFLIRNLSSGQIFGYVLAGFFIVGGLWIWFNMSHKNNI